MYNLILHKKGEQEFAEVFTSKAEANKEYKANYNKYGKDGADLVVVTAEEMTELVKTELSIRFH